MEEAFDDLVSALNTQHRRRSAATAAALGWPAIWQQELRSELGWAAVLAVAG